MFVIDNFYIFAINIKDNRGTNSPVFLFHRSAGLFVFEDMEYKPFLIQKLKSDSPVRDSLEWNIYIKSIPFKVFPDMKDIPSRSWSDQNGDDEFVPDNPVFKAYSIEVNFVYKGNSGTAASNIKSFISYLAKDGMFSIYDTYTKIGRTNVRYESYSEDYYSSKSGGEDIVTFSVSLKVNDPITDIILSKT